MQDIDTLQGVGHNPYGFDVKSLESSPVPNDSASGNPSDGMGASKADAIRELWGFDHANLNTNAKVAGFQIAIWDIIYGTTDATLSASSFGLTATGSNLTNTSSGFYVLPTTDTATADAVTWANTFLNDVFMQDAPRESNLFAIASDTAQDQLVLLPPSDSLIPVPLPHGVYAGAALMTLLYAGRTVRRTRRG
jgi:hypothetical protein